MTITGPDISHWQGSVDFTQIKAAGHTFVVLKATDGTGGVDPMFVKNRSAAHAAGLIVGIYHFVEGGSTSAETAWYLSHIAPLQAREFMALDFEIAYPGDHVSWCRGWLDAVAAQTGVNPLIYMNKSEMNGHDWTAGVSRSYGLWLAVYDGTQTPPAVTSWSAASMKQLTDRAPIPGIAGPCDLNVFFGSADQLIALGNKGDDDMASVPQAEWNAVRDAVAQLTNAVFSGGPSMAPPNHLSLTAAIANVPNDVWWNSTVVTGTDAAGKPVTIPVLQYLANMLSQEAASAAALQAMVQALASSKAMDPAAVGKAVQDAVTAALEASTVKVDVNVAGGQ